jgi:uncharacterized protein (DUF433 family)
MKMHLDTGLLPISSDPDVLGGMTVFAGTRVPVRTLFEYLEDDISLDEFLMNFPTVKRADAVCLLEAASDTFSKVTLAA